MRERAGLGRAGDLQVGTRPWRRSGRTPAAARDYGLVIAYGANTSGFDLLFPVKRKTLGLRLKLSLVNWIYLSATNCVMETDLPQAQCQAEVLYYTSADGGGCGVTVPVTVGT